MSKRKLPRRDRAVLSAAHPWSHLPGVSKTQSSPLVAAGILCYTWGDHGLRLLRLLRVAVTPDAGAGCCNIRSRPRHFALKPDLRPARADGASICSFIIHPLGNAVNIWKTSSFLVFFTRNWFFPVALPRIRYFSDIFGIILQSPLPPGTGRLLSFPHASRSASRARSGTRTGGAGFRPIHGTADWSGTGVRR